jgi:hypothetical protein
MASASSLRFAAQQGEACAFTYLCNIILRIFLFVQRLSDIYVPFHNEMAPILVRFTNLRHFYVI